MIVRKVRRYDWLLGASISKQRRVRATRTLPNQSSRRRRTLRSKSRFWPSAMRAKISQWPLKPLKQNIRCAGKTRSPPQAPRNCARKEKARPLEKTTAVRGALHRHSYTHGAAGARNCVRRGLASVSQGGHPAHLIELIANMGASRAHFLQQCPAVPEGSG